MKGVLLLLIAALIPNALLAQDSAIISMSHDKAIYQPDTLYTQETPIPKPVGVNAVRLRLVLDRTDLLDPNVNFTISIQCSVPGFTGAVGGGRGGQIIRNGQVITASALGFSPSPDCPSYLTSFSATGGAANTALVLQMWEDK